MYGPEAEAKRKVVGAEVREGEGVGGGERPVPLHPFRPVAQLGQGLNRRHLAATGLGTIAWSLVLLGQLRGNLVFTLLLCAVLGVGSALLAIPTWANAWSFTVL